MTKITFLQIGKNGLTENFIETLRSHFKKNKTARISVLKSARPEGAKGKEIVKKFSEEIAEKLGERYRVRTIGFVIVIKKLKR